MGFFEKRITMLVGNYGSGKTELSLNGALYCAARGDTVTLVDLDIVNPYFRSAEHEALLHEKGIRTLHPTFALTTVDIPALPADILSIFHRKQDRVVIDVGGDDTGAVALGGYKPYLEKDDTQMLFVINTCRPLSGDADSLMDLMDRIENRARHRVDALVNNTNLSYQTDLETLLAGQKIVEEVSQRRGTPITMIAGEEKILRSLPSSLRPLAFPLTPFTRPDWL